jgi:hypothetical protein
MSGPLALNPNSRATKRGNQQSDYVSIDHQRGKSSWRQELYSSAFLTHQVLRAASLCPLRVAAMILASGFGSGSLTFTSVF